MDTGSLVVNTSFLGDVDINQNGIGHINLAASVGTIELSTGVGALKLSAGLGGIDVSAIAGLVSVEALVGGIDLTTGIGEIGLTTAGGAMLLTTGAGAITVTTALGDILISAAAGGIEIVTAVGEITIGGAGAVTVGAVGAVTVGGLGLLTLGGVGATTLLSGIFTGTTGVVNWATPTFSVIGDFDASNITANSSTNSTSISTGSITTPGGMGIAQDVFIGGNLDIAGDTTYTGDTTFAGQVFVTNTTSIPTTSNDVTADSSALNVDGSVAIYGDRSFLLFQQATLVSGSTGPPLTITRSPGTRIVISPTITPISVEFAIGIDTGSMWYSVPTSAESHVFYCGPAQIGNFTGNGLTVSVITNSNSTSTGALRSFGGLGVALDSYFGGLLNVGGSLSVGGTSTLSGKVTVTNNTSIGNSNAINSSSGALNVNGDLAMYNNRVMVWAQTGLQTPSLTNRSTGTRLVLYPGLSGTNTDHAIGAANGTMWYSVSGSGNTHTFYCAATLVATLGSTSLTLAPTTVSSSTSTGGLIVGGGAGIAGNVFIGGTTNSTGVVTAASVSNSTSTSTGSLITAGGLGIAKDTFIGGLLSVVTSAAIGTALSVGTTFSVTGQSFFTNATTIGNSNTVGSTSGAVNVNGSISMYGNNEIVWPASTVGVPTTTTRSVGTRLVIWPGLSATNLDYAIGTSASVMWYSTDQPNSYHVFYCGPSQAMSLNSIAMTVIPTTVSSSTTTGSFINAGGAGIAGNVFIGGTTNSTGVITASSTTNSTSSITGSIITAGGLGVALNTTLAGTLNVGGDTAISSTTASSSTTTGALIVGGGLGVAANVNIGANLNVGGFSAKLAINDGTHIGSSNSITSNSGALNVLGDIALYGTTSMLGFRVGTAAVPAFTTRSLGTRIILSPTISGTATDYAIGVSSVGVWYSVPTTSLVHTFYCAITPVATISSTAITASATTVSSSTTTGSLISAGGAGIAGNVFIGGTTNSTGVVTASSTTNSTSSVTGSIVTAGGLGVALNTTLAGTLAVGGDTSISSATNSISTSTGAINTAGGVGIAKDVYIGGNLNVAGASVISGGTTYTGAQIISNATHIGSSNTITTASGALNVNGDIAIYGSTSMFGFATGTSAVPAFTTRSLGTRIILSPSISGTTTDHALGISSVGVWYSVPTTSLTHTFYCANTPVATISSTAFTAGASTSSTSASTGSIITAGGIGVAKAVWGGDIFASSSANFTGPILTSRSPGSRFVLSPTVTSTTADAALGVSPTALWYSTTNTTDNHTFYSAATLAATLNAATGLLLASTASSTSTTTGSFVTPGGVGIGGATWIGGLTNLASTLTVGGATTINNTLNVTGQNTLSNSTKMGSSAPSSTNGGVNINGDISLYNVTSNMIGFNTNGVAAPTTTTRSLGTKLLLYPSLSGSQADYAIGIQAGAMWYSTDSGSDYHIFYGGNSQVMSVNNVSLSVMAATNATSSSNGAIITAGGISCQKDCWIGGSLHVGGGSPFSYSEGTWTPNVGGWGGTNPPTINSFAGTYAKIGKIVTVYFFINFNYVPTGGLAFPFGVSLPFPPSSKGVTTASFTCVAAGNSLPFYFVTQGTANLGMLMGNNSGGSLLTSTSSQTNQIFEGTLTYTST